MVFEIERSEELKSEARTISRGLGHSAGNTFNVNVVTYNLY
jgi:hypothetical protein